MRQIAKEELLRRPWCTLFENVKRLDELYFMAVDIFFSLLFSFYNLLVWTCASGELKKVEDFSNKTDRKSVV